MTYDDDSVEYGVRCLLPEREQRGIEYGVDHNIPGFQLYSIGGEVPCEATGKMFGMYFYYRDRHGYSTLRLSPIDDLGVIIMEPSYDSDIETVEFGGVENFFNNLSTLIRRLEKSVFRWEFGAYNKNGVLQDEFTMHAHSPELAYERLFMIPDWCEGEDRKRFAELIESRREFRVDPMPLNSDDRFFPEVDPDFKSVKA